jgi:hypothetical protein
MQCGCDRLLGVHIEHIRKQWGHQASRDPKGFPWHGGGRTCATGSREFLPIRESFDWKWRHQTSPVGQSFDSTSSHHLLKYYFVSIYYSLRWICIVLTHQNNSPRIEMSLHSDTLSLCRAEQHSLCCFFFPQLFFMFLRETLLSIIIEFGQGNVRFTSIDLILQISDSSRMH